MEMISLTKPEVEAFLTANSWHLVNEDLRVWGSKTSDYFIRVDWTAALDKAIGKPPGISEGSIVICTQAHFVPTEHHFPLSEKGLFDAFCKVQELDAEKRSV